MTEEEILIDLLERIAEALEKLVDLVEGASKNGN